MSTESIHPAIERAILEAARAGVFRRAERLNPAAPIWGQLAEQHSKATSKILALIEGDKP